MKRILFILLIPVLFSSCATRMYVANGARDHKPLVFNDEYYISDVNEITVEGKAFWGIPSYTKNNKNNYKNGYMFNFNGLPLGKVPRIFPILTMISYSVITTSVFERFFRFENKYGYKQPSFGSYALGALIGIPIAGTINNFTWSGSSLSGSYASFKYQLVTENPNTDLFFYPKYEIYNKNMFDENKFNLKYLWFQESTFKCRVKGATLKNIK